MLSGYIPQEALSFRFNKISRSSSDLDPRPVKVLVTSHEKNLIR